MFNILRSVVTTTISKSINPGSRGFCWIKNIDGIYSVGLKKETIELYDTVNSIEISCNNIMRFDEDMCFVNSKEFVETIAAPFDCKIVERNYNIMESINSEPENKNCSWILRFEPIIWGQTWKIPLDESIDIYFNNYRSNKQKLS